MRKYRFDLMNITSLEEWFELYLNVVKGDNSEFFERNREGYTNALAGGCGCPQKPCKFIFLNTNFFDSEEYTGFALSYLFAELKLCTPDNRFKIEKEIELLQMGKGQSLLDWIIEPALNQNGIEIEIK